jgi:thiol-disulfide isomerase/thioredoxin
MELKNAVAVCLISLFSATLVVLIARTLDSQAASRLEPQLARIVEELEAIRRQGGIATSPGAASIGETADDGLVVYYFHSNTRCPTCQSIESQAKNVVQSHFAAQAASGQIVWKVLNYEQPANAELAKKFDIQVPVVVLARMKAGKIENWNRLDEVWGLFSDKPAFAKYVRGEIAEMLGTAKKMAAAPSRSGEKEIPSPTEEPPKAAAPKAPAATEPLDLPVPE